MTSIPLRLYANRKMCYKSKSSGRIVDKVHIKHRPDKWMGTLLNVFEFQVNRHHVPILSHVHYAVTECVRLSALGMQSRVSSLPCERSRLQFIDQSPTPIRRPHVKLALQTCAVAWYSTFSVTKSTRPRPIPSTVVGHVPTAHTNGGIIIAYHSPLCPGYFIIAAYHPTG